MSSDYYLVCEEKKIYMPLFTMVLGSCSLSSKNWMFDFVMATSGSEVRFVSEHVLHDMEGDEDQTLEEQGWTFMNAWHPHPDDKAHQATDGEWNERNRRIRSLCRSRCTRCA